METTTNACTQCSPVLLKLYVCADDHGASLSLTVADQINFARCYMVELHRRKFTYTQREESWFSRLRRSRASTFREIERE